VIIKIHIVNWHLGIRFLAFDVKLFTSAYEEKGEKSWTRI